VPEPDDIPEKPPSRCGDLLSMVKTKRAGDLLLLPLSSAC